MTTYFNVAEHFHSLQGEGTYAGTPMHFIRLVGCNVGKDPRTNTDVQYEVNSDRNFPILSTGRQAQRCHNDQGQGFWCDTDYQHGTKEGFDQLLQETWERYICITGGEPLLHNNLDEFIDFAFKNGRRVHIESSGTIYKDFSRGVHIWLCISPKQGYLDSMLTQANEIKLLVGEGFNINAIPQICHNHKNVFVQPVNDEHGIDKVNLQHCLDILKLKPHWRLSVQLHKVFDWR